MWKKYMYHAYVPENNSIRKKQTMLLMIPNGEKWQYLAVKKLSSLSRVIA